MFIHFSAKGTLELYYDNKHTQYSECNKDGNTVSIKKIVLRVNSHITLRHQCYLINILVIYIIY